MSDVEPAAAVAVFGAAHFDRILRARHKAVLGVSNAASVEERAGGVAFNVARTLSALGIQVRLVSRLGEDATAERVQAIARAAGMDMSGVTRSAHHRSASYHPLVDVDGSLIIGMAEAEIYDEVTPEIIAGNVVAAGEASLWIADANLPAGTLDFLTRARTASRPLAVCTVSPEKARRLVPMLSRIDILYCNRSEAETLLGVRPAASPVARLAESLMAKGVARGTVTDGGQEMAAWSDGTVRTFAPFPARVVNVNGAGDSLAAGVSYGIARGIGLLESVPFGLAAAALKLEHSDPVRPDLSVALLNARLARQSSRLPA